MKLIIDIPEHDKNVIERFVRGDGCEDFPPSIIENLIRAVYFGTPIEKHDEEIIKETVESIWGKPPCDDAISRKAVMDALCDECELFHRNGEQTCLTKCESYHFLATLPSVYLQNADVLDKIRAKIEKECEPCIYEVDFAYKKGLSRALEIIDKYRGKQNDK